MPAARTSLLALLLAVALGSLSAVGVSAQTTTDTPTGGNVMYPSVEPDEPSAQDDPGSALDSFDTVVTRIQSRVYLYRWMAPLFRHPYVASKQVSRDHFARRTR